jgi:uncharacterized protein YraI
MSPSTCISRGEARPPARASRYTVAVVGAAVVAAATLFTPVRSDAQTNAAVVAASVNLNQRAGPATVYPVLQVVPAGGQITLYGCVGGFTWCDGVHRGTRGWLSAAYLRVWHQGQYITLAQYANSVSFPVVAFNLEAYWGRHYANQPFYPDRARWVASPGVSVGIQVGHFYNRLAPHGRWVWINGQYVWSPIVDADWRPYTDGRWVYNARYGWTWVSNEPFGWATYHYGRWGYSHRIGWFWVPGTRWAPAWVSWRYSGDTIAWAPLPPDPTDSFSFGVSYGNIPNYYWQPVPANLFLSINLNFNIIRDEQQKAQVLADTQEAGGVTEDDNAIVNQVLPVDFVEEVTQEEVTPVELALTSDPEAQTADADDGTVQIFTPSEEEVVATEPEEVVPIETVEAESTTAGQAPAAEADTEDQVPPPPPNEVPPVSESPLIMEEVIEDAVPADAIEAEELVCPEGSILQEGECVLSEAPPPPPPVTEEEAPVEGEPAPPTADEPPPTAETPPAPVEAPPATEEPAAPPLTEEASPPAAEPLLECPEGLELRPDGICAEPPLECPEGLVMQPDDTCVDPVQ